VLSVLIDMLGGLFYARQRETVQRAADLREAAEAHRRIFKAIRAGDRDAAIAAMTPHLRAARSAQTEEQAQ
jgi:DNA-binding FadR family transcriptional regulator